MSYLGHYRKIVFYIFYVIEQERYSGKDLMMSFYLQSILEGRLIFFPTKVNCPNSFNMVKFLKSKKLFNLYSCTSILIKDPL